MTVLLEADYAEPYVCKVGPFQTQRNYLGDKSKVEVHCINIYGYISSSTESDMNPHLIFIRLMKIKKVQKLEIKIFGSILYT